MLSFKNDLIPEKMEFVSQNYYLKHLKDQKLLNYIIQESIIDVAQEIKDKLQERENFIKVLEFLI